MITDTLLTDSLATVATHPQLYSSDGIALSGMAVVFMGLVLIALTIFVFNLISQAVAKKGQNQTAAKPTVDGIKVAETMNEIPGDHLIAIGTVIELYRRLHLELPTGRVTFIRGEEHSPWKTGVRYGQRQARR